MLTSWGARARPLTDGQVVTLIVGLGLDLLHRHAGGRRYGPVHPTHVRLDTARRPHLVDIPETPGWTARDDWVALLRLGRSLGSGAWASGLSWDEVGRREGRDLLRWVALQCDPQPLPASSFPEVDAVVL